MTYDPYKSRRLDDLKRARSDGAPGEAEAGAVMTRLQREMEKRHKIPILDIDLTLWWLIVPVLGYFTGAAIGKLLTTVLQGAIDLEGLFGLSGIVVGFWVWLRLKDTLGFVKTMALFMAAAHSANAANSAMKGWDWEMFFWTILFVLGILWLFPLVPGWVADWRGAEPKAVRQGMCLIILAVVGIMLLLATPLGWFIPIDPYAILLGSNGLLGLGDWGGFVVASLWFVALWNWGE